MPNSIKYSTTGDTQSLRKGNLYFGTGDVGKGPSSVTQHYNGVTPNGGGYTIYFYDPRQPNNIGYDPISSDVQLIRYTNGISGQNFTGATQCFNWYATQTNYTCVNEDYDGIITNGLVLNLDAGFLPSYPTSGTTWYDLSYSGNNGTLTNGPTYSSLDGGSIVFDGVDDYMVRTDASLKNYTTVTANIWMYVTSSNAWETYFSYNAEEGGLSQGWGVRRQSTNNIFQYWGGTGNSGIKLYQNGQLLNSANSTYSQVNATINNTWQMVTIVATGVSSWNTHNRLTIATRSDSLNSATSMKVGTFNLYNRELSAAEILKNYNAGLARFNTPNIVKSNLLLNLDSSNTVSYPTTGTTWTDLSGNGYNGTLTNGPTFDATSKSIVFDGVDDYVNLGQPLNVYQRANLPYTMESLVYLTVSNNNEFIIGNTWDDAGFHIRKRGSTHPPANGIRFLMVQDGQNGCGKDSSVLTTGWYHIVGSYNGAGPSTPSNYSLYINGSTSGVSDVSFGSITAITPTNDVNIGRSGDSTSYGYLNGKVELTRVYNKALSQSEILQNYYQAPIVTSGLVMSLDAGNLVSYSGTGTTWRDLTTNGNNGTLTNGPTYSSANGGSILFDGSDDKIVGGNFSQGTIITINIWFKQTSSAVNKGLIAIGGAYYYLGGAGFTVLQIYNGSQYGAYIEVPSPTTWNMATFVITPTTSTLYLNGSNPTSDSTVMQTSGNLYIGSFPGGGSGLFNGNISTVQIYNRSLTADEIAQNYNAQKSRFGL